MCVWTLEKEKWTLKKSDQLSPYSFSCLRVKSAADQNDGKRGGEKKGTGLPNIHVADVKEAPPRLTFLWCWGGAGKLHLYNINFNPWYEEKDAGNFKKTSKGVTDGIAGSKKNKAGILLQGKIKKRREAFGALSFL